MNQLLRTLVVLPALIVALVVIPTVAFSASRTDVTDLFSSASAFDERIVLNQTSPLPTPTDQGTVPPPTATPIVPPPPTPTRYVPPPVYPTATPRLYPTPMRIAPTPTPIAPKEAALIGNLRIKKVIGDRLSSTIYAYISSGWLYRSNDDGRSWTLVTTQPGVDDFIMNADNPDVLYSGAGTDCADDAASNEPMYKSIDGGLTWTELPNGVNMRPLLSHQGDENSIFAADCLMIYLSTDGGETWTGKPDTSTDALWNNYRVVDMVAASMLGDPQPDKPNWNQIFASGVGKNGSGVLAFTNDLGDTWVRLTPNINPAPWSATAVTADPFIEGLVAFSEPKSVWFTTNFGVNWQVTTKGLSNVADRGIPGAAFGLNDLIYHPGGEAIYLATARGLYMKESGVEGWTKIPQTSFDLSELTSMLLTESSPNKLWLNSADGVFIYLIK